MGKPHKLKLITVEKIKKYTKKELSLFGTMSTISRVRITNLKWTKNNMSVLLVYAPLFFRLSVPELTDVIYRSFYNNDMFLQFDNCRRKSYNEIQYRINEIILLCNIALKLNIIPIDNLAKNMIKFRCYMDCRRVSYRKACSDNDYFTSSYLKMLEDNFNLVPFSEGDKHRLDKNIMKAELIPAIYPDISQEQDVKNDKKVLINNEVITNNKITNKIIELAKNWLNAYNNIEHHYQEAIKAQQVQLDCVKQLTKLLSKEGEKENE